MEKQQIQLHYILGFERTGSTVLHNTIYKSGEFLGLGEVRHLNRMKPEKSICGYGKLHSNCKFWNQLKCEVEDFTLISNLISTRDSNLLIYFSKKRTVKKRTWLENINRLLLNTT